MKQAYFCLFLFSMKCTYLFASHAGHHTFHAILRFSLFFLLFSHLFWMLSALKNHCIVFSIELFYFLLGEERNGKSRERMEATSVLLCSALGLQLYVLIITHSYWILNCVPGTGLSIMYALGNSIVTTVRNLWYNVSILEKGKLELRVCDLPC